MNNYIRNMFTSIKPVIRGKTVINGSKCNILCQFLSNSLLFSLGNKFKDAVDQPELNHNVGISCIVTFQECKSSFI